MIRRTIVTAMLLVFLAVQEASAERYLVGDKGWVPGSDLSTWAQGKHFYNGDWLFFVFDRNQQNVLEVRNKTAFDSCISDDPLHNWTRGAGRDVVPLNITKTYYFISGNGFCYSGVKIEIHVENTPPPPSASPVRRGSPPSTTGLVAPPLKAEIVAPTPLNMEAIAPTPFNTEMIAPNAALDRSCVAPRAVFCCHELQWNFFGLSFLSFFSSLFFLISEN